MMTENVSSATDLPRGEIDLGQGHSLSRNTRGAPENTLLWFHPADGPPVCVRQVTIAADAHHLLNEDPVTIEGSLLCDLVARHKTPVHGFVENGRWRSV